MPGALLAASLALLLFGLVVCGVKMGREDNKERKVTMSSDKGASFRELRLAAAVWSAGISSQDASVLPKWKAVLRCILTQ